MLKTRAVPQFDTRSLCQQTITATSQFTRYIRLTCSVRVGSTCKSQSFLHSQSATTQQTRQHEGFEQMLHVHCTTTSQQSRTLVFSDRCLEGTVAFTAYPATKNPKRISRGEALRFRWGLTVRRWSPVAETRKQPGANPRPNNLSDLGFGLIVSALKLYASGFCTHMS